MLLSMRMILNRLERFSTQAYIRDADDTPELMSARMAYAPHCLQISAHGSGILCKGAANNYFIIEDIGLSEGFEIVQGIFDYYNNWEADILSQAAAYKFQELLDSCHLIFGNPVALIDGNYRAIATSSAYGDDGVDNEWRHIRQTGFSSVETIRLLKRQGQLINPPLRNEPQILAANEGFHLRMANIKIFWNNEFCGRLVLRQLDRSINSADLQILSRLAEILAPHMAGNHPLSPYSSKDVFAEIMTTGKVDTYLLERYLEYLNWESADEFYLVLIHPNRDYEDDTILHTLRRTIFKLLPFSSVNIVDGCLAVICSTRDLASTPVDGIIDSLMIRGKARVGISLPLKDLACLHHYYRQTVFALQMTAVDGSEDAEAVVYAFHHMIPYILHHAQSQEALYACHPDVLRLIDGDRQEAGEHIKLLRAYLDNERNISNTAKALFMHRNTLVYRLEKLSALMRANLDEPYERDYLKLSIYIIELYRRDLDY